MKKEIGTHTHRKTSGTRVGLGRRIHNGYANSIPSFRLSFIR